MNNIKDLNLENEILPLFNTTNNKMAKGVLLNILLTPLRNKKEVLLRQKILKGFIKNKNVLKDYTYPQLYLHEVHGFLINFNTLKYKKNKGIFKYFITSKKKFSEKGKFIQLILLFYKLHIFFSKINLTYFPEEYKQTLTEINDFFIGFELEKYNNSIKKGYLSYKNILEIAKYIEERQQEGSIINFWNELFLFESYLSISNGIITHSFIFPSFSNKSLSLTKFYHPLLKNPITNNLTTNDNVILLTGPNMSGKSTLLKAISLCVYLGHLGFAIPVLEAKMPFYNSFSIFINHHDDILNGYSHFMTELINLKTIILQAKLGNNCFAVFDELFNGTNTEDALEIGATTVNGLAKFDASLFFISTHLHQLKNLINTEKPNVSPYFIGCELENNEPNFTYKLMEGWSNLRIGRILFEKEGLNKILKQ
ncbi:MAG: hypothetical protein L3J09_11515 [Flavobacteriaceae bacterium]|nr:hypothetical protein [Flavobacteriaceae bacterium]